MKRSKAEAAVTREAVLNAARALFERRGYAGTTLDQIAAAAKVTRGAVYHHFANKAEIYQTLVLECSRKSVDLIPGAIAEGGTFLEIIERIFVRQLQQFADDPEMRAMAIFTFRADYEPVDSVREHIAQTHGGTAALLTQAIAEAQAAREVRQDLAPRDIARAFYALQNGLVHHSTLPGQSAAVRESAAALAKVLIAGIAYR